jgi:hypothetical protein
MPWSTESKEWNVNTKQVWILGSRLVAKPVEVLCCCLFQSNELDQIRDGSNQIKCIYLALPRDGVREPQQASDPAPVIGSTWRKMRAGSCFFNFSQGEGLVFYLKSSPGRVM